MRRCVTEVGFGVSEDLGHCHLALCLLLVVRCELSAVLAHHGLPPSETAANETRSSKSCLMGFCHRKGTDTVMPLWNAHLYMLEVRPPQATLTAHPTTRPMDSWEQ